MGTETESETDARQPIDDHRAAYVVFLVVLGGDALVSSTFRDHVLKGDWHALLPDLAILGGLLVVAVLGSFAKTRPLQVPALFLVVALSIALNSFLSLLRRSHELPSLVPVLLIIFAGGLVLRKMKAGSAR